MTTGLNTWKLVLYNDALHLFPLELLIMGELKKIKDYMIYFENLLRRKVTELYWSHTSLFLSLKQNLSNIALRIS